MKPTRHIIIWLCIIAITPNGLSQDTHFSQFWTTLHNTNPALVGFFDGNGRLTFNQRIQWSAITKPYTTTLASYDFPLKKRAYKQDIFAMGISAYRDVAGDSHFGTTQLSLSFSYLKSLTRKNNNFICIGTQWGGAQRNIIYSELYFDEQFVNGQYDPNSSNSEQFSRNNFLFGDVSIGGAWIFQPKHRKSYQIGLSISHLNQPKQSLFDNQETKMDLKTMITISTQQKGNANTDLFPIFMASFQGTYKEIITGAEARYIFDKRSSDPTTLNAGLYYRWGDAAYLMLGANYLCYHFGISYDINSSELHNASHYQGGWEVSFNYIFKKSKLRKIKEVPCPIF